MGELYSQILEDVLESSSINESKSLVDIDSLGLAEPVYQSSEFTFRTELLKNLFNSLENDIPKRISLAECSEESLNLPIETPSQYSDRIVIQGWKNIENISARLIEYSSDQIILECLIDKENSIYEERIFRPSLFSNYKLEIGNLFYLRFFERPNEIKMEVHDDPDLTFKEDFQKLDFVAEFKDSKLFRKKGN